MAIPKKKEFDAWLSLATTPLEVRASLPTDTGELTIDDATAYLNQAGAIRQQRWDAMCEMPAWRWLTGQREFARAQGKVFNSRRRTKGAAPGAAIDFYRLVAQRRLEIAEQAARRMSEERFPRFEAYPAHIREYRARDFRKSIERMGSRGFDNVWETETMRAVAEYIEGKAAERFLDAAANIESAAKSASEAVARYVRLANTLNGADFRGILVRGPRFQRGLDKFDIPELDLSPIGRRKAAKCDGRLFVYRMFVANWRAVRSSKVDAITELMGLDGFRVQYDSRTIERLCAGFKKLHRLPAANRPAVLALLG